MVESAVKPRVVINETSVMIKPVGPKCNLRCSYCYYLPVHELFEKPVHTLSDEHLESVFKSFIPKAPAQVMVNWQGGEPTLAGLDFFKRAVAMQKRYCRPGQQVSNTLQTNGTLLDDDWCRFLHDEEFLIGLSIDGRRRDHDAYRVDAKGQGAFDRTKRGLDLLKKHQVEFNVLCVLQKDNVKKPAQVWDGMLKTGANWFQFIPAVEWVPDPRKPDAWRLASFSPKSEDYGDFLCWIFDEWYAKYRDRISIRIFDSVLQGLLSGQAGECTLAEACSGQLTVEHDGGVYGCDHFVQREWQLGAIGDPDWKPVSEGGDTDLSSFRYVVDDNWVQRCLVEKLQTFSDRKSTLPEKCLTCDYKRLCWGGCPKHRGMTGGELEPTILCAGYLKFFRHAVPKLEWLAGFLRRGQQPPPPGFELQPANAGKRQAKVKPNEPCPCGSGKKYKKCCGPRQGR